MSIWYVNDEKAWTHERSELTVNHSGTHGHPPTAMVSVAVIDKLRTSVISIGYRTISTERGAGAACKGLCAKGDDTCQSQQVSPLRSWLISVRATARSDAYG